MNAPLDSQSVTAFWLVIGSLVLSNLGLIINAVYSHFKRINKMSDDLDSAHKKIRVLEKTKQNKITEE